MALVSAIKRTSGIVSGLRRKTSQGIERKLFQDDMLAESGKIKYF